ncbi:MAG: ribokinase [Rectinema subterraneum]|jgi:ribokinase
MRILNFGSLNIDYVYRVDSFVKPGETKAAQSLSVFPGGKGLNQSLAMARAGLAVAHAGKVGKEGGFLLETLRKGGVDTRLIETSAIATGHAIIQVDDKGGNCILLFGGANQDIDEHYIDRALAGFGSGDMLVLQNEISSMASIISKAKSRGMAIALNPSPYSESILSYPLELVDIFIMNEIEAKGISGTHEPEAAASLIARSFPQARIVITLGENGSLCLYKGELVRQKAYKVQAVDTTAAGDTFSGYFLAGLVEGLSTKDALDLAARAAAICVTRKGAADSVPWRKELE